MPNCLTLKKSNCKNCYKCIRHCPVTAIRFSGNQAHIIGNECILCGQCFVVCPQNAKQIVDETEKVKVFIQSGDPVVVSLAPSFVANYEGIGINSMRDALQKLGFYDVEETAIGATIVKNEYERMLAEDGRDIIITSCCHSINLLIQKYFPQELEYLADVVSPMQAHCMDIKKRFPKAKTVFIGPCVAKKDEAEHYEGIVDAVLTFEELTEWMKDENVELKKELEKANYNKAVYEGILPDKKEIENISGKLKVIQLKNYGEIVTKNTDKAYGMEKLSMLVGVSHENTIAIGDSMNDFGAFQYAGTSIAMGNAEETIKDMADIVCEKCSEYGVSRVLERIFLKF